MKIKLPDNATPFAAVPRLLQVRTKLETDAERNERHRIERAKEIRDAWEKVLDGFVACQLFGHAPDAEFVGRMLDRNIEDVDDIGSLKSSTTRLFKCRRCGQLHEEYAKTEMP